MKLLITLTLLMLTIQTSASPRRGGAEDTEQVLKNASSLIAQALGNLKISELSEQSQKIFNVYGAQITNEFINLNFNVDHKEEVPFKHFNNAETWIETDLSPMGEIRVRTQVMRKKLKKPLETKLAISYLGHEVGHHIVGENENEAWKISGVISEIAMKQVRFPELLNISGKYSNYVSACRNEMEIEANPINGKLSINYVTDGSGEGCSSAYGVRGSGLSPSGSLVFACQFDISQKMTCSSIVKDSYERLSTIEIISDHRISINYVDSENYLSGYGRGPEVRKIEHQVTYKKEDNDCFENVCRGDIVFHTFFKIKVQVLTVSEKGEFVLRILEGPSVGNINIDSKRSQLK